MYPLKEDDQIVPIESVAAVDLSHFSLNIIKSEND